MADEKKDIKLDRSGKHDNWIYEIQNVNITSKKEV